MWKSFIASLVKGVIGQVIRYFIRQGRRIGELQQHNKQLKEDADAAAKANLAASNVDTSDAGVLRDENNRLTRSSPK